jgi:hypothetical protein
VGLLVGAGKGVGEYETALGVTQAGPGVRVEFAAGVIGRDQHRRHLECQRASAAST